MQELVTLTMKEQQRYDVIKDSLKGRIKVKDASLILGLGIRQIYRLREKVKKEGIKGVIHGLRGKVSPRKISEELEEKIKQLYKGKYFGFNLSHFTEYLNEEEGVVISREKVRQILRKAQLYPKKPKKQPKHRIRREPMPQEGLLTQLDTSEHLWLPSLGKNIQLILLVDDATNKLVGGKFVLSDSTLENMKVLEEFFRQNGLPSAIYLDRDSKFKTQKHSSIHYNLKGDPYPDTQIKRALNELGITLIYAGSPQAKGRIERDFQSLQDRLINELKLHNITSISEANHYLKEEFIPKWNRRFAREPKIKESAFRAIPQGIDLNDILCLKEERTVYPDNTVSYKSTKYQILPDPYRASYAKAKVEKDEHLDNRISIVYKNRKLKIKKIQTQNTKKETTLEDLKDDIFILQKR